MPDKIKLSEEATASTGRDRLLKKVRTVRTFTLAIADEPTEFKIEALSRNEVDDLQNKHLPRRNNKADEGSSWNTLTFPPALMAKAIVEPKLTEEEWAGLFQSDDWASGEINHIFQLTQNVTIGGFEVPRSARD